MYLDARKLEQIEIFRWLKEMIATCGSNEFIEVLVSDHPTVQKIRTFAAMSGCPVEVEKRDGDFILRIAENTCGCGR